MAYIHMALNFADAVARRSVIFVELSQLQKDVYQHILRLPEFKMLKEADEPCMCGVNQAIFDHMIKIQDEPRRKQLQFLKANPFRKKKECCGDLPIVGHKAGSEYEIDERAVIWKKQVSDASSRTPTAAHLSTRKLTRRAAAYGRPAVQAMPNLRRHALHGQAQQVL